MRKAYAIILLIPVLTLFAGSVTLASSCAKMAAGCGERAMTTQKCTMAATHQGCKRCMDDGRQKCHKGQTGKGEKKDKDGGSCCMDCPLCCLVTFKPFFRWDIDRQATIIDYTVMSDHNLSDYFQQHWKPPSGSFLS